MARRGLLLINLGTTAAPTASAVRPYLREFLMDERVIDVPYVARWSIVHLAVLPTRPKQSAHAYQQIWSERGSPLLAHSRDLTAAVAERLAGQFDVELGMRYGQPSLEGALRTLREKGVEEVTALPLYPQHAASTTGSTLAKLYEVLADEWDPHALRVLPPFYDHPRYLDAVAAVSRGPIAGADHVLFSFHGIPERQLKKSDVSGKTCLATSNCCDRIGPENRRCYRAQSYATARLVAEKLGLPPEQYSVSFQSRLGRTPWIRPYTDEVLPQLRQKGVRRLAVLCPSFVADCLETLEEVGIRGRDQFLGLGGESFTLVPSLNSAPEWVEAVVEMARS